MTPFVNLSWFQAQFCEGTAFELGIYNFVPRLFKVGIPRLVFQKLKMNYNKPFAARGYIVQNPTYWRAKECNKTPLENVNKEKSHYFDVWHILLHSSMAYLVPCDLQLQKALFVFICSCPSNSNKTNKHEAPIQGKGEETEHKRSQLPNESRGKSTISGAVKNLNARCLKKIAAVAKYCSSKLRLCARKTYSKICKIYGVQTSSGKEVKPRS